MKTFQYTENLSLSARTVRVVVSTLAIVAAMESTLAGTSLFAVVSIAAIGLATSAIIGWDPVKSVATNLLSQLLHHGSEHRSTHA